MKKMPLAAAMLITAVAPSAAGMRYDQKLEQAAMAIVAGKMGDIRGGFSYAQKPQFVVRQEEVRQTPVEAHETVAGDPVEATPPQAAQPSSIATF